MSEIEKFEFQGHAIRIANPDPFEVVANDIIRALYPEADRDSYRGYLLKVPEKWRGVKPFNTPGGSQNVTVLSEPGLWYFVSRSNSPLAEPFQDWLYEEVLPQIRKTGQYTQTDATREETVEPLPEAEEPDLFKPPAWSREQTKLWGQVLSASFEDDLEAKLGVIEKAEAIIKRNSRKGRLTYMEQVAIRKATQKALRE